VTSVSPVKSRHHVRFYRRRSMILFAYFPTSGNSPRSPQTVAHCRPVLYFLFFGLHAETSAAFVLLGFELFYPNVSAPPFNLISRLFWTFPSPWGG